MNEVERMHEVAQIAQRLRELFPTVTSATLFVNFQGHDLTIRHLDTISGEASYRDLSGTWTSNIKDRPTHD